MKKPLLLMGSILMMALLISSCAHKDCRGNKHKVKTEMGGYL